MNASDVWSRIELREGDITHIEVDAIVNAANERLAGGGGVDGAIHRTAGHAALQEACRKLGGCPTGDAKITPGFALPAKYIIHTVGPVYGGGDRGEAQLLESCYQRSLEVAEAHGVRTIAFPAISTGIYGYPFEDATTIALRTTAAYLADHSGIERVVFVYFGQADFQRACAVQARLRTR